MSRLDLARDQIIFARNYTRQFLDGLKADDWFRLPPSGVTHIAWQVGHLALAQYRLAMERVRGRRGDDENLISDHFLQLFARESIPRSDPDSYPSAADIRAVFDRVHEQLLQELTHLDDKELDEPILLPHRLVKTKLWALLWCAMHETLHAGQIGLLRRQFGYPPIW